MLNRARNTREQIWRENKPINDNFDIVAIVFVKLGELVERIDNTVHSHARKTFLLVLFGDMQETTLFLRNDWRKKHQFTTKRKFHDFIHDILNATTMNFAMANWTMRHTNPSKK